MKTKNTQNRYGWVAMLLHWLMTLLMIGLLALGLYMAGLPFSMEKLKFYGWHKETGILVLALAIIRVWWCLLNVTPDLQFPVWQKLAARAMHLAFYGFMFVLPLTGWLMSSASGLSVSFFGLWVLPDLIAPNQQLSALLREAHEWLAYGLIGAICVHTGAALWHHFIQKDDILRRMLP